MYGCCVANEIDCLRNHLLKQLEENLSFVVTMHQIIKGHAM